MTEDAARDLPSGPDGRGRSRAPGFAARLWRRSATLARDVVAAAAGLLATLGVVLAAAVFVESLVDRTIDVQPLSVPRLLSDDGLSSDVAALELRDQMGALADRVRRERGYSEETETIDPEELPDVAVPSVGLSAQALASAVRAFFKIQTRQVITGEIVSEAGAYGMTLRLNGQVIHRSAGRLPRDQIEALFGQAARAALRSTQPYAGAVVAYDECDYATAIMLCDGIIGRGGAARAMRFAHLLRAQSLSKSGRPGKAAAEYEALIALDPRDIAAHVDLGDILADPGRKDGVAPDYGKAVAEYERAIAVDGALVFPHRRLARAYLAMGRAEDAVAEARTGVALRPGSAVSHRLLADALRSAGRDAEAAGEADAAGAPGPEPARPAGGPRCPA